MSLLVQAADYLGNYALSSPVHFKFSVTDATGALTTLGGTPVVKVYKDDGTTESTAGITLTVDFDSRVGLCHVAIDTSSDGTFYAGGHDFEAVLTAGTVGLVSVAGTPVGHFSLLNRVDTLADGVVHGGGAATIAAKQMRLQNADANESALLVKSTAGGYSMFLDAGTNTTGLGITGNGVAAVDIEAIGAGLTPAIYLYGAGGYLPGGLKGVIEIDSGSSATMTAAIATKADFPAAINGNLAGTIDGLTATGLDNILIDGKTLRAALEIIAAVVAGKVSGAGTTTETFLGLDGLTTRAVVSADSSGNRSAVSYP